MCHLSRTSVANIESGRQQPTVTTLVHLARALETTIGILAGTEPMTGQMWTPAVRVVTTHLVECEMCGTLATVNDPVEAEKLRRQHLAPHPAPAVP